MYYVPTHLKGMNRRLVYDALARAGEISRAELARVTGISAPTVGKIVLFFVERGIVSEIGTGASEMGRKPKLLRFNADAYFTVGVDFEGGYLKIGIVDLLGNIKSFEQIPVKASFDELMAEKLAASIGDRLRAAGIAADRIWGVGIGIPGVVDVERRTINVAPLIGVAEERSYGPALDRLERQLGLPVFFENDANAAAIGEYHLRRDHGEADLVYLSIGTGVGGGIILEGQLRKGLRSSAGEVGYMIFDRSASSHRSRAGWLERRISHSGFLASKGSDDFVASAAADLGLVITNLALVLDINLFVIGGSGVADYGDNFLDRVTAQIRQYTDLELRIEAPQAAEPAVIGAGALVVDNMLGDKMQE